jgi:CDP-glucose 4,6-dehydratase
VEGVVNVAPFGGVFSGLRVLVTGHTGFKGSWLSQWLLQLGSEVHGVALEPNTKPALFDVLGLSERIASHSLADVRDARTLTEVFDRVEPDLVLHLAAQPLVRRSYGDPVDTWATNVMGTINVLEAVRRTPSVRACVVVTTDKCYENREWVYGYREDDPMGGHDPYSASKGATELAVSSWRRSFFADANACRIATARAGNVIGGGDWAEDRLVVDFVKAMADGADLRVRNPRATRPWQHVLEPLSGYLALAARLLADDGRDYQGGWNLGPGDTGIVTVETLARLLVSAWGDGTVAVDENPRGPHEAGLLKLDVSKALAHLQWHGIWDVRQAVSATVEWYRTHLRGGDVATLTLEQIASYTSDATHIGLPWAQPPQGSAS